MVDFGGWDMPVQYSKGILKEHLATRRFGGLFDVSHMGRFRIKGKDTVPFLQHVLTNNAESLDSWQAQYTLIPNENGGLLDDDLGRLVVARVAHRRDPPRRQLPVRQVGRLARADAGLLRRRVDGDKDDGALSDGGVDVGGKKEVASSRLLHHLLQPRLVDGQVG